MIRIRFLCSREDHEGRKRWSVAWSCICPQLQHTVFSRSRPPTAEVFLNMENDLVGLHRVQLPVR